jgi:hypothetical protein
MSGHDFEKQVRQKLNDLKIIPSADSWENIENKLRERKRRPVAFYWMPLLLLGLAAGGYFILNNDQKTILSDKNSTPDVNVNVQPDNKDISKKDDAASRSSSVEEKTLKLPEDNDKTEASGGSGKVTPAEKPVSLHKKRNLSDNNLSDNISIENKKARSPVKLNENIPGAVESIINKKDVSAPNRNSTSVKENNTKSPQQKNTTSPQEKSINGKNLSLQTFHFPTGTIAQPPLKITETPKGAVPKINKKVNTNKWSYGLSAFAGISAVNEGHILNFNNAQVQDVAQVAGFAPRPAYTPSSISPGFSFSGGAFVMRELSDKFSVSLGLNYLQMNTRNKVGSERNGSQVVNNGTRGYIFVYNYFTVEPDEQTDYRNKYHFIEMPVELHTKINKSKKTPITVNTGVAVSQLLKSNSLHFDGTTGVYYRNDKLLNQTQFAVKTGVSVGLLNKTTRPIVIGPSARYNVSKILQKDVSARKNFMSLGVDVKMFIR